MSIPSQALKVSGAASSNPAVSPSARRRAKDGALMAQFMLMEVLGHCIVESSSAVVSGKPSQSFNQLRSRSTEKARCFETSVVKPSCSEGVEHDLASRRVPLIDMLDQTSEIHEELAACATVR